MFNILYLTLNQQLEIMTEQDNETLNFFAAQAMNALLSKSPTVMNKAQLESIAPDSYIIAKLMLKESKKQK